MENGIKVLITEDEKSIRGFLSMLLESGGYKPLAAPNGETAISMIKSHHPDIILLDLGLPDMDGIEVLGEIRKRSDVPVIVVSARQSEQDKITALDAGANDYITKPFGNGELLARIRTAMRLWDRRHHPSVRAEQRFFTGSLSIDYERRLVSVNGSTVHLTPIEYRIVTLLSRHAGRVLTHDFIIRDVWGEGGGDSQMLRVNMANIRKKLEPDFSKPMYFLTEIGVGYRMADNK